ncbi:MAG TPA: ISAzo13 family transposase [Gemmataceae bacterium]|nr:ISAzo13 family transposase [Gemmataceae bacterium]
MVDAPAVESLRVKYERLRPLLNERLRRQWAAAEALALGWGGSSAVADATGLSRTTIWAGILEVQQQHRLSEEELQPHRIRAPGAGRPAREDEDATLRRDLEALVEPTTRGDPMSPLRWTCKSTRQLAGELRRQGHQVGYRTVAALLHALDYSLQGLRKTREGARHPDRNAQFEHINRQVRAFQKRGQPVISVDTKEKELVGDFKNGGREWQPQGEPQPVRTHDFKDKELGKVVPYGVYDQTRNKGWVSVGIDHDTSVFATETIRRWWHEMGHVAYPLARELLVTADSGGSNSSRSRLWKVALQQLADDFGLAITVCHFPPGTSKWNKIEHRMFCHITNNWRGRPLLSRAVIVSLIGDTQTETGLHIEAALDTNAYATGIKVTDEQFAAVRIRPAKFHGEWNYTILPK